MINIEQVQDSISFRIEKSNIKYITEYIEDLVVQDLLSSPQIGIDTETCNKDLQGMEYGLDPHLGRPRLLQLCPHHQNIIYVFDLAKLPERETQKLKYILSNVKALVGQNLRFEIKMLWGIGIDLTNCKKIYDTEVAEYVLSNGLKLKKSLKNLSDIYLNLDVSKELQVSDWSIENLSDDQLRYAALDALLVLPIKSRQIELGKQINKLFLEKEGKNIFDIMQIEFNFIKCIAALEFNGMFADINLWEKNLPEYEKILIDYELDILKQLPNTFKQKTFSGEYKFNKNISSPNQLLEDLKLLGVPTNSTSEGELKMLDTEKYPIIKSIDKYRKTNKIINTYLKPFRKYINQKTNRVHPSYFQLSSKTGRVQVKDPALYTIPRSKDFRQCFLGQNDYYLLDIDYSQIESRCTAVAANETRMLDIFNNDQDIYAATGALENGYEINEFLSFKNSENEKLKKIFKDARQGAKSEVLGLQYGMGVDRYRDYCEQTFNVKKTREKAEKERQTFLFSTYPGLPKWHKNTWKKWNGKYYIFNQTGRIYFNTKGIDYTFCINFPIQSVATDFFKIAASNIFDYLKDKYKVPPILNYLDILLVCSWHDALTFEGKKSVLEEEKSTIEQFMVNAAEECLDYKVKIKAEGVIEKDWYSAHA